jgi:hypothetical protein
MSDSTMTGKSIEKVPFAGIRKALDRANELAAKGVKVIHFEAGRPDFDTPSHIKEAAKKALDQGIVYYAPSAGLGAEGHFLYCRRDHRYCRRARRAVFESAEYSRFWG